MHLRFDAPGPPAAARRGARRRRASSCALAALALFGALTAAAQVAPAAAQKPLPLDSLFRAHRLPLDTSGARISGPGMDALVAAAADAQFVMIGESHNLKDIPRFTGDLFEALRARHGFDYLVLEDGPEAVALFMAPGVRGDLDASFDVAAAYVNALQFWTDQEVELIARVGASSPASYDPVWGVDNEWGALHLLEGIRERAPDAPAGAVAERVLDAAMPFEKARSEGDARSFLREVMTDTDVGALEDAYATAGPGARRLLASLRTAYDTYAARAGAASVYTANDARERLMRRQFTDHYRRALETDGEPPRAVAKFGQWHALAGVLNWGWVRPFGTFLAELAASNGLGYVGVWTGLVNEPGHVWTLADFPDYAPLAAAGDTDHWWLVDVRPIRALVAADLVEGLNDELRKVVFGFDFALLIGGGDAATRDRLEAR